MSPCYKLESPGERELYLGNCLTQIGLTSYLWEYFWLMIDKEDYRCVPCEQVILDFIRAK